MERTDGALEQVTRGGASCSPIVVVGTSSLAAEARDRTPL